MRPLEKGARSTYPDVVEELSNKVPTFALWGWERILVIDCCKTFGN